MKTKPTYEELHQRVSELEKELSSRKMLEQGWLTFMDASTEGFGLYDSDLNLIQLNGAAMNMLPSRIRKKALVGTNMGDFAPFTKKIGQYEKFKEVIRTGIPFSVDNSIIKENLGEERHFRVKAFKVGEGLGLIAVDITDNKRKEKELLQRKSELKSKAKDLEELNAALKALLIRRDKDKLELEEKVILNIRELVIPHLNRIKTGTLDGSQRVHLDILEENLKQILSSFIHRLSPQNLKFTPTELQVANFIRQGENTKQIAKKLNANARTIEFHRANIRKKLGLNNKKTNLRTFLLSMA